jgi:hypothetical protein
MKKITLLIALYLNVTFAQTLDTIKKIEIYYGYGAQCFPRDGIYAKSERFIFEKSANGSFELAKHHKFWNISKNNATVFSKDSSITNLNKKYNNKVLLDLITNLNIDNQNFSYSFLKQRITKPSSHRIKKIAKEIDRFFILECDGIFDCEYRNKVIDSIQKFNKFDEFISSMNLTKNQLVTIGYYDNAIISIISQSNITSYNFSFVNNCIGQPIIKHYNNNYMNEYGYVNLIANEKIRELIPKNSITYKALDLEKITDRYIRWYLEN